MTTLATHRGWRIRTSLGIVAALAMLIVPQHFATATNSAGATNSTSCNDLNMMEPTNSTFTYYRSSLETAMYNAAAIVVNTRVNPTDFTVVAHSSSTTSTDVVYFDGDYTNLCNFAWHGSGGNVIGLAKCNNKVGAACDRHYVYFDTSWVNASGIGATNEQALACHETGHTFGIKHTTGTTCMASNSITNWSTHEINDIINWTW